MYHDIARPLPSAIIYIVLYIYYVLSHYCNVASASTFAISVPKGHEVNYIFWYIYKKIALCGGKEESGRGPF